MEIPFYRHRFMIWQLTKSEISRRYRGSYLGLAWCLINPLIMLAIYTFVFGYIFKTRWAQGAADTTEFAILLFCGLNVYNIFSESIIRATSVIAQNANYVKKVIFPLEILPITVLGSALINSVFGFLALCFVIMATGKTIPITAVLLPIVLLPFILITLGVSWLIASTSVYLKDIENIIGFAVTGLMFMSPIFYPITAIPPEMRFIFSLNPVTYAVEDVRRVLIWGQLPDFTIFCGELLVAILILVGGYKWFAKVREGFADVL